MNTEQLLNRIKSLHKQALELEKNLRLQGCYDDNFNTFIERVVSLNERSDVIIEKLQSFNQNTKNNTETENLFSINSEYIFNIFNELDIKLIDTIIFPAKNAQYAVVPENLHPIIKTRIEQEYSKGLYAHQSKAIEWGLLGHNVCIATPTASGKTLIFTSIAISHLLSNSNQKKKIIAFYPVKALLHDQYLKWQKAVKDTELQVEIIDGGVKDKSERLIKLEEAQILLMTPDVVHAWLMSDLDKIEIRKFLALLDMIILDEAHIYNGVLGTNMAYLLRRLRAISGVNHFLASSATIDNPIGFLEKLTGLSFRLIGKEDDAAAVPKKEIILCRMGKYKETEFVKSLLESITQNNKTGKFLIFLDSRKRVEELAAASQKWHKDKIDDSLENEDIFATIHDKNILPYRAGYEDEDRKAIQNALTEGSLSGVVTTNALELGIDIGDIELVIMLGEPPSIKSFWQRAGRAARLREGIILLFDTVGRITSMGLTKYLNHPAEPNNIYLENNYLQYVNALCAADEYAKALSQLYNRNPFTTLPNTFIELLDNEIEPVRAIPEELYELKQRANNRNPHNEFPFRNEIDDNYKVKDKHLPPDKNFGNLTYTQVLREAFPGAIHRYIMKAYRINTIKYSDKEIIVEREKGISHKITKPITQTMVFPRFNDSVYTLKKSKTAFIAECKVQVSERVIGFTEEDRYGRNKIENIYGLGNRYAQKPLTNIINTTGICFYFPEESLQTEVIGEHITFAFCRVCSILKNDIGYGTFSSQISPLGNGKIKGFAIYDSIQGSLRLTKQIIENLDEILIEAIRFLQEQITDIEGEQSEFVEDIKNIISSFKEIQYFTKAFDSFNYEVETDIFEINEDDDWRVVIKKNQIALYHDGKDHINEEITILGYIYREDDIKYTYIMKNKKGETKGMLGRKYIKPILGITMQERYNINTGEVEPYLETGETL